MSPVHLHVLESGQYKGFRISVWIEKRYIDAQLFRATVEGTYPVHCNDGWSHEHKIDQSISAWDSERTPISRLLSDAYTEDGDDALTALIATVVEGWLAEKRPLPRDPCATCATETMIVPRRFTPVGMPIG